MRSWFTSRSADEFEIAAITVAELRHGVERATGARRSKREKYIQAIVAFLPVISYTEETAYAHARIWAELTVSGKMIGYDDLIVAAIAIERGSAVATFNQRHFSSIAGLTLIEPC